MVTHTKKFYTWVVIFLQVYIWSTIKGGEKIMTGISTIIEIFASNPPSIAIALGFLLLFFGHIMEDASMINSGWGFAVIGFLLQVLWLLLFRRR